LLKVLEKGDVRVASSEQLVSCSVDGVELVYSLPAGQLPDFDGVFKSLRANDGPRLDRRAGGLGADLAALLLHRCDFTPGVRLGACFAGCG
jgi:hypothetical protein